MSKLYENIFPNIGVVMSCSFELWQFCGIYEAATHLQTMLVSVAQNASYMSDDRIHMGIFVSKLKGRAEENVALQYSTEQY